MEVGANLNAFSVTLAEGSFEMRESNTGPPKIEGTYLGKDGEVKIEHSASIKLDPIVSVEIEKKHVGSTTGDGTIDSPPAKVKGKLLGVIESEKEISEQENSTTAASFEVGASRILGFSFKISVGFTTEPAESDPNTETEQNR